MKRMYGLIRNNVNGTVMDLGHAVNSMFHAGAMIESRWPRTDPDMADWYANSFRKVTCRVNDDEFARAKLQGCEYFAVTEMAFGNEEVVLVFKPRDEFPKFFQFLKLYR